MGRIAFRLAGFVPGCLMIAVAGCHGSPEPARVARADNTVRAKDHQPRYPTVIHRPYEELGLNTERKDLHGRPVRILCRTCHDKLEPSDRNLQADHIPGFHGGVVLEHGDHQSCRGCHHSPRFQDFRLVTGRVVLYSEVMDLCAQCHGEQYRDYQHGAHGGMTGYWDLDSGPRDRNHCLDCHNAHRPAIPRMVPAPRPIYRFVDEQEGGHGPNG